MKCGTSLVLIFFATSVVQAVMVMPKQGIIYEYLNGQCEETIPNSEVLGLEGFSISCACKAGYQPSQDRSRCKPYLTVHCKSDEFCRLNHTESSRCSDNHICECIDGFTMDRASGKCSPIGHCKNDSGCWKENDNSPFCNEDGFCEEMCSSDNECYPRHGEHSHCSFEERTVCECDTGYIKNSTSPTCRKKQVDQNMAFCTMNNYCVFRHGIFSHCGPEQRCVCKAGYSPSTLLHICLPDSISSFPPTDVKLKKCDADIHCYVEFGYNSECDLNHMCRCLKGYKKAGQPAKCLLEDAFVTEVPKTHCYNSSNCYKSHGENAVCRNGKCLCGDGYTFSEDHATCLHDQSFKNCKSDQYCQKRFDVKSFCSFEQKCTCKDDYVLQSTVPRCVPKPADRAPCQVDEDCMMENSHCHSNNTCICRDGFHMTDNKTHCHEDAGPVIEWVRTVSTTSVTLSVIVLVLLLLLIMSICFYFVYTRCYKQIKDKPSDSEKTSFASNVSNYSEKDEKPLNA